MTVTAIEVVKQKALTALQNARALIITTQDEYVMACEARKALKAIEKDVLETHNPVVKHWDEKHKKAVAEKNADLLPVQEAGKIIGTKMSEWETVQEVIRRADEERLRRIAQEQEQTRRLAEAAAREEESRRLRAEQERLMKIAEEAAAKGRNEESERALAAAAQAESESIAEQEQATQEMEEAISAPAPVVYVAKETPKVSGISYSDHWSGVCDDLAKLVKAVAEGKASISLVMVNQPSLNKRAQSDKTVFDIPGCRAVNNPTPNIRL